MGDKSILYFSSKRKWIPGSVDAMWIVNSLNSALYDSTQFYQYVIIYVLNFLCGFQVEAKPPLYFTHSGITFQVLWKLCGLCIALSLYSMTELSCIFTGNRFLSLVAFLWNALNKFVFVIIYILHFLCGCQVERGPPLSSLLTRIRIMFAKH